MTKNAKPSIPATSRRGGRPSRQQSEKIENRILDTARDLFFSEGYGFTSLEKIAQQARMSKRTLYHRFDNKAALFRAVVQRLIKNIRPSNTAELFEGHDLKTTLLRTASAILSATLSPQALSLHRIIIAEANRFPELSQAIHEQGARQEAISRIAELLDKEMHKKHRKIDNSYRTAEIFMQMIVSQPQRRALGLGHPMNARELEDWTLSAVELFLHGLYATPST